MKKSSWFKIGNSCGLAGNSFREPDFLALDQLLGAASWLAVLDS